MSIQLVAHIKLKKLNLKQLLHFLITYRNVITQVLLCHTMNRKYGIHILTSFSIVLAVNCNEKVTSNQEPCCKLITNSEVQLSPEILNNDFMSLPAIKCNICQTAKEFQITMDEILDVIKKSTFITVIPCGQLQSANTYFLARNLLKLIIRQGCTDFISNKVYKETEFLNAFITSQHVNKPIVIFTDMSNAYVILQMKLLTSKRIRATIVSCSSSYDHMIDKIMNIQQKFSLLWIITCNNQRTKYILEQATQKDILTLPNQWLIISHLKSEDVFANISLPVFSKIVHVTNNFCSLVQNNNEAFNSHIIQLIEHKHGNVENQITSLPNRTFFNIEDTCSKETVNTKQNVDYLIQIYSLEDSSVYYKEIIASWNYSSQHMENIPHRSPYNRDLHGVTIRITFIREPYLYKYLKNGKEVWYGFEAEQTQTLAEYMNFSAVILEPNDTHRKIGKELKFHAAIAMLAINDSDFVANSLYVTLARMAHIDYSPIISGDTVILIYGEQPQGEFFYYLYSFTYQTWLIIGLTILVTTSLYFLIYLMQYKIDSTMKTIFITMLEKFFYLFLKQDGQLDRGGLQRKIVYMTFQMFTIFMTSIYLSMLTSHLTIKQQAVPFRSLQELLDKNEYKLTISGSGDFIQELLSKTEIDPFHSAWKAMNRDPSFSIDDSKDSALMKVCSHKAAFVYYTSQLPYLVANNKVCPLAIAPIKISQIGLALGFRKLLPYKKIFDVRLLNMLSSGIYNKLRMQYDHKQKLQKQSRQIQALSLMDVYGLFWTFLILVVLSIVVFVFEKCIALGTMKDHFVPKHMKN